MKILVFTEGTLIMHSSARGLGRGEIVKQVKNKDPSIRNYASYIPIKNCVKKLQTWKEQNADIFYLTSRRNPEEIEIIKNVLKKYNFPNGELFFRKNNEQYKDVAETIMPDILIEDDCESIGGEEQMTITYVKPELKRKIKSIVVKEFEGIDHLPDDITQLSKF